MQVTLHIVIISQIISLNPQSNVTRQVPSLPFYPALRLSKFSRPHSQQELQPGSLSSPSELNALAYTQNSKLPFPVCFYLAFRATDGFTAHTHKSLIMLMWWPSWGRTPVASFKPLFSLHHHHPLSPDSMPALCPLPSTPTSSWKVWLRTPSLAFVWHSPWFLLPPLSVYICFSNLCSHISTWLQKSTGPGSSLPAGTHSAQHVSVLFGNLEECVDEFIPTHQLYKLNTTECRGGYLNALCFLVKGSYKSWHHKYITDL